LFVSAALEMHNSLPDDAQRRRVLVHRFDVAPHGALIAAQARSLDAGEMAGG
jgi:hypothetical protein